MSIKQSIKIAAFGNAVTAGTSAKLDAFHDCLKYGTKTVNRVRESQTWRSITARIMSDWVENGVELLNAGMAGDTSEKGLARLEHEVLAQSPDYAMVMFGTEDVLQGVEISAYRTNLEKIVEGLSVRNIKPVLLTPAPISERMTVTECTLAEVRRYQEKLAACVQEVRELADAQSLPLIDIYQYFRDNRLMYDHLYEGWLPDGVAQTGMASFMAGELLPMLGVNDFPKPDLCDYRKVYSDPEHIEVMHHAFTDITYFQGEFFLVFRKASTHGVSPASTVDSEAIVVLRSRDGITWSEDAVLKVAGLDNRDPKILQDGNKLRVYSFCVQVPPLPPVTVTYGFEKVGSGEWSQPFKCAPGAFWRPKKWQDSYVMVKQSNPIKLLISQDGHTWKQHSDVADAASTANETDLLVEGDKLTAYARCGEGNNQEMMICTYIPSENRWETVSSGRLIHAPCVFKNGERTMIMGRYCSQSDDGFRDLRRDWNAFNYGTEGESVRIDPARVEAYHHGLRTGIFVMDGRRPRVVMELLSAGDSSYVGVVPYGDEFVISDYSMHEYYPEIKRPGDWNTPCDIYLSRIRFGK